MPSIAIAAGHAQDRREPVRGSVELADGSPWRGAVVHLLSRPVPDDERIGDADELTITADANGRFLAQLLPGRFYVAWAVEELDGDRYRASFACEDVLAGRPLQLVADEPRPRRRVKFADLDAWRKRGRVVATLTTATRPRIVAVQELTTDEWLLPPLPCRGARMLLTCDGLPLMQWAEEVDLRVADAEPWRSQVPREVCVQVRAGRKAVPGAVLSLRTTAFQEGTHQLDCLLGVTDANGLAVVTLPGPADGDLTWVNYAFGVRAEGYAPVGTLAEIRAPLTMARRGGEPQPSITVDLESGRFHRLAIRRGDQPVAVPLLLGTGSSTSGPGPQVLGDNWCVVRPPADGVIDVHRISTSPVIVLAATSTVATGIDLRTPLHPVALVGLVAGGEERRELTWSIDSLAPRVFEVKRGGVPQQGANVAVLVTVALGAGPPAHLVALRGLATDRAGRVAALLPQDLEVSIAAWTDDGYGAATSAAVDRPGKGEPLHVELAPTKSRRGRVVDKSGAPVPFATVECYVFSDDPATAVVATAMRMQRAPTRRDGSFSLSQLPGARYSLRGVALPDGDHYLTEDWTAGTDEPEPLTIDLGKAR